MYGCVYASMILLDALRRCYWGFSVCTCVCICMRMCVCVHVCVYGCMCVCACMYVCISVFYVCMCICVRAHVDVRMHSCRRILSICTVQSLYYMRVYQRVFLTLACVCVGGLEVGFVSACSLLALVTDVGGYVLTGVEIGGLSCIFLYFCGLLGWGVCVCLYTRVHTHKLLGYLM